jgi:hypothetical protein
VLRARTRYQTTFLGQADSCEWGLHVRKGIRVTASPFAFGSLGLCYHRQRGEGRGRELEVETIRLVSLGQTMGKAAGLANIQFVFARRRIVPMGLLYSSENSVSVVEYHIDLLD